MSTTKFTPGPWWASEHGDYSDYDGECIVVLGRDTRICVVQGSDDSETYHNAHLIAAAPSLYRELELARFTIAMEIATMGPRTLDREEKEALIAEHPAIKLIDDALKKARGE